jgi:drug/metabolite transporter (DMT)-like permease
MLYIVLALVSYTVFILANRFASQRIQSVLAVALINIMAAIIPVAIVIWKTSKHTIGPFSWTPIWIAIAGGLCVAIYSIFLSKAFATTNVAIVLPLVMGGIIALGSVSALVLFGEKISLLQLAGLTLVVIGMGLVVLAKLRATA